MNTSNFTYLLANPQKITTEDLAALDILLKKYPYFQSARALQLKGLKNQDSFRYNDALKLTAAHTTDRDILFEYITSEQFKQNEISQSILQSDGSLYEIEVMGYDVSEEVNAAINKAEMRKAEDILNPNLFQRKVQSVAKIIETEEHVSEDTLQTNKPLEFEKNDTHSFSEWLKLTKAKPIDRDTDGKNLESDGSEMNKSSTASNIENGTEEVSAKKEKERKSKLIDRFIQERPKIVPPEPPSKTVKKNSGENLSTAFVQSSESLMTETLAKVYLQQNNYKKAIQAYKILILKNPEKSGFFADQIRAIEKLINSEQS